MENFGNYIFLIFIILIFLLNTWLAARKSKIAKKQANNSSPTDIEEENEEWEKWFSGEDAEEKPFVSEVKKTVEPRRHEYQSFFDKQKKEIPKKSTTTTVSIIDNGNNNIRLSSAEEAKRAFIYSEIFNRKY